MAAADSAAPNIIAFVFARGGSKGLPRKNLREVGGVSLLARAIRCAKAVPEIGRVIVSTDDAEIAAAARAEGAEVPFMRPAKLASDSAREWQAWRHAVDFVEGQAGAAPIDIFVSVPPVCPLRTAQDLLRALALYRKGNADIVLSVTPALAEPRRERVELDEAGTALPVRSAHSSYDVIDAVFVTSPAFIRQSESIWGGRNATIEIPRERAIDVGTVVDLERAEALLRAQAAR